MNQTAEHKRLVADAHRQQNWKRWGPYLSERQWGTVREDYSAGGDAWSYFPHEQARSRSYRWGEDGLLGWCDRQCRLCFAVALWNGRDPILKERLFGLTGPEGGLVNFLSRYGWGCCALCGFLVFVVDGSTSGADGGTKILIDPGFYFFARHTPKCVDDQLRCRWLQ